MSEQLDNINRLLDGDLDSFSDAQLYADLSVDSDLRTEMRDQIGPKCAFLEPLTRLERAVQGPRKARKGGQIK
jgi:hypothetical protein